MCKLVNKEQFFIKELEVTRNEIELMIERVNNSAILTQFDLLRAEYENNGKNKEFLSKDLKLKISLIEYLRSCKDSILLELEQLEVAVQSLSTYYDCTEDLEEELREEVKSCYSNNLVERLDSIDKFKCKFKNSKAVKSMINKLINSVA